MSDSIDGSRGAYRTKADLFGIYICGHALLICWCLLSYKRHSTLVTHSLMLRDKKDLIRGYGSRYDRPAGGEKPCRTEALRIPSGGLIRKKNTTEGEEETLNSNQEHPLKCQHTKLRSCLRNQKLKVALQIQTAQPMRVSDGNHTKGIIGLKDASSRQPS